MPLEERNGCSSALERIPGVFFPHRALRNIMVVSGLHYFRGSQCGCPPARVYATILLILAWTNFARHCTIFIYDYEELSIVMKLLSTSFFSLCCINLTIYYYQCYLGISLASFMHQYKELAFDLKPVVTKKLRRRSVAYTLVAVILTLSNVIYSTYAVFFTRIYVGCGAPFTSGSTEYHVMEVVSVITQFWYMQYWSVPIGMCHYVSLAIRDQFVLLNRHCKKVFTGDLDNIRDFEVLRRQHRALCTLVQEGDRLLSPFIAVNFAINTFVVCFIIYVLLLKDTMGHDVVEWAICLFWLLTSVINLSSYCIGPALVKTAVSCNGQMI